MKKCQDYVLSIYCICTNVYGW